MQDKADPKWLVGTDREKLFCQAFFTYVTEVSTHLHNYAEIRTYLEKEQPGDNREREEKRWLCPIERDEILRSANQ